MNTNVLAITTLTEKLTPEIISNLEPQSLRAHAVKAIFTSCFKTSVPTNTTETPCITFTSYPSIQDCLKKHAKIIETAQGIIDAFGGQLGEAAMTTVVTICTPLLEDLSTAVSAIETDVLIGYLKQSSSGHQAGKIIGQILALAEQQRETDPTKGKTSHGDLKFALPRNQELIPIGACTLIVAGKMYKQHYERYQDEITAELTYKFLEFLKKNKPEFFGGKSPVIDEENALSGTTHRSLAIRFASLPKEVTTGPAGGEGPYYLKLYLQEIMRGTDFEGADIKVIETRRTWYASICVHPSTYMYES